MKCKEPTAFTPLLFCFLFFLFFFLSFFPFFQRLKLFFFSVSLQPKQRYCFTQLLRNQINISSFRQQVANLKCYCESLRRNLGARLDPLERTQDKLSRLYLNTWIGHATQDIGLFSSSAQIWEDGFVVVETTTEKWKDFVDFMVTKAWPELKTLKIKPLKTSK